MGDYNSSMESLRDALTFLMDRNGNDNCNLIGAKHESEWFSKFFEGVNYDLEIGWGKTATLCKTLDDDMKTQLVGINREMTKFILSSMAGENTAAEAVETASAAADQIISDLGISS